MAFVISITLKFFGVPRTFFSKKVLGASPCGASHINYITCCEFITSLNTSPNLSAALRHIIIRFRKISK